MSLAIAGLSPAATACSPQYHHLQVPCAGGEVPPAPPGLGGEGPLTLKVCFRLMLSEGCTAATRKLRRGTLPRTLSSFSSAEETSTEPTACPRGGWGAQRLSLSVINASEPLLPTACQVLGPSHSHRRDATSGAGVLGSVAALQTLC